MRASEPKRFAGAALWFAGLMSYGFTFIASVASLIASGGDA